jgi:16S rRNA (cytosine967-C5)-methyltransferase
MLCSPKSGDLIFDLCAAPGGKTMVLSELLTKNIDENSDKNNSVGTIICNDVSTKRLAISKENIERMQYKNIEYTNCDVLKFDYPQKADIILIDAPCSGLGIIRKNVDIKYLRAEKQLSHTIEQQRKMLVRASNLLKDGGHLIYSVCSIDKEEGEENIK